jgi:hypothetical protein
MPLLPIAGVLAGGAEELLSSAQPLLFLPTNGRLGPLVAREIAKNNIQSCLIDFVLQGTEPAANAHRNWELAASTCGSFLLRFRYFDSLHWPEKPACRADTYCPTVIVSLPCAARPA